MAVPLSGRRRSSGAAPGWQSNATLGSLAGKALVAEAHGQAGDASNRHGPFARPDRLLSFASVHVEWQSYDQTGGSLFRSQSRYDERVLRDASASSQSRERGGDARVQVTHRHSDPALAEIDTEDSAWRSRALIPVPDHHEADGLGEVWPGVGEGESEGGGDGERDGDVDTEGDSPICGVVNVAAGGDGVTTTPGDALTVGFGLAVRSWRSIRKSKLGIVEAQPGETDISTLPYLARNDRASSTDLPCTAALSWPTSTIGVCKPTAVTGTITASPCVAAVPSCVAIDPATRL
jgi:hypothetical protein